MNDIANRMFEVLGKLKISPYSIAKELGVSQSIFTKYKKGESQPSKNVLSFLASKYNVNLNYILNGTGNMLEGTETPSSTPGAIPFYLGVDVMAGQLPGDVDYSGEVKHYLVPGFEKCDFLVPVRGRSMQPLFLSGDIIGCRWVEHGKFIQWGHAYVVNTKNGVVLKRIHPGRTEENVMAVSINAEEYPPFEISKDDIVRMAIVVGVVRLN